MTTATAMADPLAAATGADTPALRANDTRVPPTGRQREIIALAAAGLTNRQIAERLTISVRTVEGHLFRACQKTGLNSRDDLVKLLDPHFSPADGRGLTPRSYRTVIPPEIRGARVVSGPRPYRVQHRLMIAPMVTRPRRRPASADGSTEPPARNTSPDLGWRMGQDWANSLDRVLQLVRTGVMAPL